MQASPPDSYNDGTCNADLPNDSVYTRFLYTVRYLARNGFYVVLDQQVNVDPTITDDAQVSYFISCKGARPGLSPTTRSTNSRAHCLSDTSHSLVACLSSATEVVRRSQ